MVFGSKLGEFATSVVATDHWSKMLTPSHGLLQVDLDQSIIARDFPVTWGIVADVGATFDLMIEIGADLTPDETAVEKRYNLVAQIKRENSPFHEPECRDFAVRRSTRPPSVASFSNAWTVAMCSSTPATASAGRSTTW